MKTKRIMKRVLKSKWMMEQMKSKNSRLPWRRRRPRQ
jgi:hypothetical protein